MDIKKLEHTFASEVATLLNEHLPFEEENEQTILQAGGIQLIALVDDKVVGYIAGYEIQQVTKEFPHFHEELAPLLKTLQTPKSYYTSHLVVHPDARGMGIGKALVNTYMDAVKLCANALVVVGWVKSDTNSWDAEKLFAAHQFPHKLYLKNYFEPYDVYCPNCAGRCICDAHIFYKML